MSLLRGYKQKATYWGSPTSNGTGGLTFDTPVPLVVRWEDRQEQFTTETGDTEVSNAVVFVPQDVELGGYLLLGESTETDPTSLDEAYPVRQFRKIPDLRGARSERRAYL